MAGLTFKLIQKPRSIRSNGVRKSTWGVLHLKSKDPNGKSEKKDDRSSRQAKKRKHREIASDGDMEWEALTGESGEGTANRRKSLRGKTIGSLNLSAQELNGETAAVVVGLRADTPGPAERIRFKDVLKRRNGLQEYLECRNMILGLWERDVRHSLCVTDCGISSVASLEETSRESLLRAIYDFLNYHGYINLGIVSKKLKIASETQATESKQGHVSNQEVQTAGMGSTSLEKQRALPDCMVITEPEPMDIDEKPSLELLTDLSTGSRNCTELKRVSSPAHFGDEESLFDMVNRLKAKNRKKKEALQKPDKVAVMIGPLKEDLGENYGKISKGDTSLISHRQTPGGGDFKAEVVSSSKVQNPNMEVDKVKPDELDPMSTLIIEDQPSSSEVLALESGSADKPHMPDFSRANADEIPMPAVRIEEACQKVIIVGAGPAGLAAGRHLQNLDISVTILEARERVGGRVFTDRTRFSGPVDLGASIITGVEADVASERRPDPTALLCKQLDLDLTTLGGDCPLFDSVAGARVPAEIDEALEAEYNSLLDDTIMLVAQNGDTAMQMSLEEGLELVLKKRKEQERKTPILTKGGRSLENDQDGYEESTAHVGLLLESNILLDESLESISLERRVMDWHFANLEYGCAAELNLVSLPYWNQDDVYGGFAGPHCMIKGGYGTVMEALGDGLPIILGQEVTKIEYFSKEQSRSGGRVKVHTKIGDIFMGDAVLVTIPLGCLKVNAIDFVPSLPGWKTASIQRLGFGVLNKVVMEFPFVFWDENIDFFGATAEKTELRGRCFMFWNLKRTVGAPVLSALVVGKAAIEEEQKDGVDSVEHALCVLRSIFGEASVPKPTAFAVTKWGSDPYSRGAYSYVAVGASGEDYDIIGRSVENCIFFAGEATCKEHPDTVGGAIMTGLREAVRIADVLNSRGDSVAEAEAMAATQRQSDTERNEVRDMTKRLTAAELSIAIRQDGGKRDEDDEPFNKAILLQDMFGSAKTTSGRLLLAKEMLQLPASSLKAFAGTREGLAVLNSWIQDSMGKDGTQLLRHCVRLLLVVGKDLSSVRQSGIGRTVKEKVVVHTSRDIRAVASQLVKLWVETFRKEKAARGIAKPLQAPSSGFGMLLKKTKARAIKAGTVLRQPAPVAICSSSGQRDQVLGPISDSEAAALAAAETAQAAANAAAKAYETAEAASTQLELPKILSFHKFANKREHTTVPESIKKRPLEREVLVLHRKDQVTTGVDARNCKVRDWSIDFSDSCSYLGSPSILAVQDVKTGSRDGLTFTNPELPSLSSACTESLRVGHCMLTQLEEKKCLRLEEVAPSSKEAADEASAGSSMKGTQDSKVHLVPGLMTSCNGSMPPSNSVPYLAKPKKAEESSLDTSVRAALDAHQCSRDSTALASVDDARHNLRASEHKRAVTDYVSNLLLPLYKTRKLDKDGFKSIVKKSAVKVIERQTEHEAAMEVAEFLDTKRKIKIRTLVDKFVERYLENVK